MHVDFGKTGPLAAPFRSAALHQNLLAPDGRSLVMRKYDCLSCGANPCDEGKLNEAFEDCPMKSPELLQDAYLTYTDDPMVRRIALAAAQVESTGYMKWTRVEDTIEFARRMNYKTLGIACCIGLKREGAILEAVLKKNGFSVVSVICKTGGVDKEKIGIKEEEKLHPGSFEAMCNPIAQAKLLDSQGSELNIVVGLCVGHDALFYKASKAPVTTLVAKDRVLCHNPVAALYNHQSYYRRKLYEGHAPKGR
jgi:uncharacterized metal-binding protein